MTVGVKFYSITRSPQLEIAVTLEVFRTPIDTPSDYCVANYTRVSPCLSAPVVSCQNRSRFDLIELISSRAISSPPGSHGLEWICLNLASGYIT